MHQQRIRRSIVQWSFIALVLALPALQPAAAKRIAIDFEGAFDSSGNDFTFANSFRLNRQNNASCETPCLAAIPLGFSVDFGAGLFDSVYINENGIVSFGTPLPGAGLPFTSVADLGDFGIPVIAPYYADLATVFVASNPSPNPTLEQGELFYSAGQADPFADASGAYSLAERVPAFRVTWNGANLSDPVYTQLYLYAAPGGAAGDFDIRFSYGNDASSTVPAGAIAGFALGGTNAARLAEPLNGDLDYVSIFRGGQLQNGSGPPSPVPEPSTLALLTGSLLMLALCRRRLLPAPPR